MAEIKFGTSQLGNPIPAKTTKRLGIMAFVLTTLSSYVASAPYLSAYQSSIVQGILSTAAAICLGLIPFYGVETTQKKVDVADVTVMETKDK